jgi:c-di-GMP-binding flagellar brake protein YcgR
VRSWLSSVQWDAQTGTATLSFQAEHWTCTGTDARALAMALDPDAVRSHVVLVSGSATVTVGTAPSMSGTLELDTERIRFQPDGHETPTLDAAWSAVDGHQVSGLRQALTAQVAGRSLRVEGDLAPTLAAWLTTLAERLDAGTPSGAPPLVLERWPAKRLHGPLALQGDLVVSGDHVQFIPSGFVERTLRLKDLVRSFKSLERIVVHGWTQKCLTFVAGSQRDTFTFDDVDARFDALVQALHQGQASSLSNRTRTRARIDEVLERWSNVFDRPNARIMEAQLAVQVRGQQDATVGVLLQTTDEVRFLPSGGPTGTAKAEAHPVPRILRNYSGPGCRSDELCFSVAGDTFRYVPSEGEMFVRRFWDRCRSPSRIFHLDTPSRRALNRVLGPSRFVQVQPEKGEVLPVTGLHQTGRTWTATLVVGTPLPALGTNIHVDVGQPEGVYRFESQVVDVDAVTWEVHFSRPSTIRVYNQRQSVRVSVDLAAQVRVGGSTAAQGPLVVEDSLLGLSAPPNAAPHRLHLSDLSLGGCAAEGSADLPLGASVEMEVQIDGTQPLRVTGRVLRADRVEGGELRRFGIRFENIRRTEEVRLQRHVLQAQRSQLAGMDAMVG